MSADRELFHSAVKFLSGDSLHICRLCFASTENREICLNDCVMLARAHCQDTLSFYEMFMDLGVNLEPSLPQVICFNCATNAINSYLFQKLYQFSNDQWNLMLNRLERGLDLADNKKSQVLSLFLLLNDSDPILLTSRKCNKEKTKTFALKSMTSIMKSRNWYTKRMYKTNSVICEECGMTFKSTTQLMKHNRIHRKPKNVCQDCGRRYSSPFLLQEHVERVHQDKLLKCPKCDQMFSTERMLKQHDRMRHVIASCEQCSISFPSRTALRVHTDRHAHHTCSKCKKTYTNKYSFKFHTQNCGREKRVKFFCDMCDKGYVGKNGLRSHIKMDHGFGTLYACDWCEKKYDAVSRLKCHIVKHTKERNYHCEHCGGRFVTHASLVYHTRLHTGEKPFRCDLCTESFLSASRRMEHKRRKHWAPQKECLICKAKFVSETQLKKHSVRHNNPQSKLYVSKAEDMQDTSMEGVDSVVEIVEDDT